MRKILLLTLALCLAFSSLASAASWKWLTSTDDVTVSINTDNITRVNGIYTVWVQIKYADYAQKNYKGEKIAVTLEKMNFKRTEMGDEGRSLEIIDYSSKGNFLRNTKGSATWESVIPSSIGEQIFQEVLKLRSDADKEDDIQIQKEKDAEQTQAEKEKRSKQNKENTKVATDVARAVLGGLF